MSESYAISVPSSTSSGTPSVPALRSVVTAIAAIASGNAINVNGASAGVTSHKGDTSHNLGAGTAQLNSALGVTVRISVGGVQEDAASVSWQSSNSFSLDFDVFLGTEIVVESLL